MLTDSESTPDAIRDRVRGFLAEHDPAEMARQDFNNARFDAGLAWVHYPEGLGGLGVSRTLQSVVDAEAEIAIIDITGVPTVDTLVAQHLLKTVAAARLMGADCVISGIRPQIAQTIVHLGLTLSDVTTKATMADAIELAFARKGLAIAKLETP